MRGKELRVMVSSRGCMSWISMIVPLLSRKAMERGRRVFFIQKEAGPTEGITKSIPESGARDSRNMRPAERSGSSSATSARTVVEPMRSVATGNSGWAVPAERREEAKSRAKREKRVFMTEEILPNLLTAATCILQAAAFPSPMDLFLPCVKTFRRPVGVLPTRLLGGDGGFAGTGWL